MPFVVAAKVVSAEYRKRVKGNIFPTSVEANGILTVSPASPEEKIRFFLFRARLEKIERLHHQKRFIFLVLGSVLLVFLQEAAFSFIILMYVLISLFDYWFNPKSIV